MPTYSKLYKHSLGLLTDLYQLTMAYGYWKSGRYDQKAVFHLFYRENPFGGKYVISAGLEVLIDYINELAFTYDDVAYLGSLKGADGEALFEEGFLDYLQQLQFSCDIDAIPEGTVVFPQQPLIRVRGPLLQAQLIETALLNIINFSSLIATKASRIVQAAQGDAVLEFGLRRSQGIDGGLGASRAAYIGGCHATSNVLAGKLYGIPLRGTHAHSWVMAFDSEAEAFNTYAAVMPNNCVFLVDTFNTLEGIQNAIRCGHTLKEQGHDFLGIRLDSGDLATLSQTARQLLDEAGFPEAKIIASNDLDEYKLKELKERGARINVWGVGTRLSTAYEQPALGGVYKLSAIQDEKGKWKNKIKFSEEHQKTSNPGQQQVLRLFQGTKPLADLIVTQKKGEHSPLLAYTFTDQTDGKQKSISPQSIEPLLVPVFEEGQLVYSPPDIHQIRERAIAQQKIFAFLDQGTYSYGLESDLAEVKAQMIQSQTSKKVEL